MLLKQVGRTFRDRKLQVIGIFIMILMSAMIYTMMTYSTTGLAKELEDFFEVSNMEDFSIEISNAISNDEKTAAGCAGATSRTLTALKIENETCYYDIIDDRQAEIESYYSSDFTLEFREIKEVLVDGHKYLFINDMQDINTVYLEEGSKPTINTEVAITKVYADKNDISVGDTITINGKDYTVTGFFLIPDYTMPILDGTFNLDTSKLTFVLTTPAEFANITGYNNLYYHYAAKVVDGKDPDAVIKNFNNTYETNDLTFVSKDAVSALKNVRSGAIYGDLNGGAAVGLMLAILLSGIAVIIIAIVVGQILRKERGQIGLLKALGFTNGEIIKPYLLVITIISIPALLFGYILGSLSAAPLIGLYRDFYLIPDSGVNHSLSTFLIAVIIPLIIINLLSYVVIKKLLKETPLEMQKPKVAKQNFLVKRTAKKQKDPVKKFRKTSAYGSISKLAIFFIGIVSASFMILFAMSFSDSIEKMGIGIYEQTAYTEVGYCDNILVGCDESLDPDAEYFLYIDGVSYDDDLVSVRGIDPNNDYYHIYDTKDKDVTTNITDNDIYITSAFSKYTGTKKGDTITLDVYGNDIEFDVVGVTNDYINIAIYTDINYLQTEMGIGNYTNVAYTGSELTANQYVYTTKKADIIAQSEMMGDFVNKSINSMIFAAMLFGFAILFIIISFIIEDNNYSVSMLKVFGYNDKEIKDMVLKFYRNFAIIIFLISVPIVGMQLKMLEALAFNFYGMYMPIEFFNLFNVLIAFGLTMGIYYLSSYLGQRKLNKISLQESMKLYQE